MKSVAIVPNIKKDISLRLTEKIIEILCSCNVDVILSDEYCGLIDDVVYLPSNDIYKNAELVITVGGDGTLLGVAEAVSENSIPVIGVNLGRMGFMAELEPEEIPLLKDVINGKFSLDKRMMLDASVIRNGVVLSSYRALNDIVVGKGSLSKISELELYCDSTFVSAFHSDGLIISTPTGSTAYSLSAGSAIIDPDIDCLLFTPVCSHSFANSRPIVFSPKSVLEIKDVQTCDDNTYMTVDGRINERLMASDVVRISVSERTTNLVKIKNEKFYNRVYQKIAEKK